MNFNDIADKMIVGLARFGRSLRKPELRAKVDVECHVYPDGESDTPTASVNIKNEPKIKIAELILALIAVRAIYRLLRDIFRD